MKYIKTFESKKEEEFNDYMKNVIEDALSIIKVTIKKSLLKSNLNWYEFDKPVKLYEGSSRMGQFEFNNYNYTLYLYPNKSFKHDTDFDKCVLDISLMVKTDNVDIPLQDRVDIFLDELSKKGFKCHNHVSKYGHRFQIYYNMGKVIKMTHSAMFKINQ